MSKLLEIVRKNIEAYQNRVIVFDKDELFTFPEIQSEIASRGYEIVFVDRAYYFRIHFELNRESDKRIVYISKKLFPILLDIRNKSKVLEFGLRDIYPFFDISAIKELSFPVLNTLAGFKIYESIGYNETIKFVLENIYNVDFDTLKSGRGKERLLNALVTVFLERNGVNQPITEFLSKQARPYFPELIESGLTKTNLLNFVERKWKCWLIEGDDDIDFEEFYLTKTIGFLFVRGQIKPIKVTKERYESLPTRIGVFYDENQSMVDEFNILIEYLNTTIGSIEDKPQEWFDIIQIIARAKVLSLKCHNNEIENAFSNVEYRINERFQLFIEANYDSLISRSGSKHPYLVTRILEYMRYQVNDKKAVIVLDGMSYWQCLLIAESLKEEGFEIDSKATFAWIPTITAWSRQAIFRGDLPDLSETNSREEKHFSIYWNKAGYADHQIGFARIGVNKPFDSSTPHNKLVLGIVINDLDDLMHGVLMGDEQLYLSTNQWIGTKFLSSLISTLKKSGYKVFITTDHGNIEAKGIRNLKLNEKFGAMSRSKRHIRFSNEIMKNDFLKNNITLPVGVKDSSVYLKDKSAFVTENERLITHGGSHFWEVILPFVEI